MRSEIERELADILRSRGEYPKGSLCESILVPSGEMADEGGADLVQATVDFTNWAMNDAHLLPGEFPLEALCAYYADYYLAEVNNGGHAQWACNSDYHPLVVKTAGWGLEAMGAHEYLTIHQEFVRLMSDPEFSKKILASESGFNGTYEEVNALDDRFYALDADFSYPMLKISAAWLKSLPHLKALQPETLEAEKSAVIAGNPYWVERRRKSDAALETSFFHWVPRKLCSDARVDFLQFTAGNAIKAEGKKRFAWFMQTSDGLMAMAMFAPSLLSGPKAKLYRIGKLFEPTGQAIAEVAISKDDFESHVPRTF